MHRAHGIVPTLLACLLLSAPTWSAERVDAETSKAMPGAEIRWRGQRDGATAALRYGELPLQRIVALHEANRGFAAGAPKATQIGVARVAAQEGVRKALPALQWQPVAGGTVARFAVTSPVALGLRVGLRVQGLDPRAELRFGGSELPLDAPVLVYASEIAGATQADGLFWSPMTDGETQTVEIFLPTGVDVTRLRVDAPQLSHLLTNTRRNFKIVEKIGESGNCNIDTACRVAELGPDFVHAKNAVAHMSFNLFNTNGTLFGTYICTGTLLNDTVPGTQVPYFFTADHCFAGGRNGVPAQNRQNVAATLNTHWNYEATACRSGVSTQRTTLAGGADLLFNDSNTDAMLLRLRNPAPSFSTFAGWDSAPMTPSSAVVAIHHPSGDAKKVSFGRHVPGRSDGESHAAAWLEGTTEGGSSGSGLFTVDATGRYRLRGGLFGGLASCANAGNLADTDNIDWYSRLDVVFPQIRQYLAPQPERRNGAQPLRP